jgi:penicillin amidase
MTQLLSGALGLSLVRSDLNPSLPRAPLLPRPEIIQALLETRPSGWVPADNWDKWLLDNFLEALRDGRRRQGTPISKWRWGRSLQWNFQHPVGRQFPFVDRYFDIGPVDMSGSGTTVKQTTLTLGPSERMVVDFGDLDGSVQNLTTGESGAVASVHYKDQWPAYYVGSSFPMEFYNVDAKETLHIVPESGVK